MYGKSARLRPTSMLVVHVGWSRDEPFTAPGCLFVAGWSKAACGTAMSARRRSSAGGSTPGDAAGLHPLSHHVLKGWPRMSPSEVVEVVEVVSDSPRELVEHLVAVCSGDGEHARLVWRCVGHCHGHLVAWQTVRAVASPLCAGARRRRTWAHWSARRQGRALRPGRSQSMTHESDTPNTWWRSEWNPGGVRDASRGASLSTWRTSSASSTAVDRRFRLSSANTWWLLVLAHVATHARAWVLPMSQAVALVR